MQNETGMPKRSIISGIVFAIASLIFTAGLNALAVFMASLLVFGCVKSPPDWVYNILFIGFPLPLIFASAIATYLFIKNQKKSWIVLAIAAGLFLSFMIFVIWFLILTQYC